MAVDKSLCEHFAYTRQELYALVRVEGIETFEEVVVELENTEGRTQGEEAERNRFALAQLRGLLALAKIAATLLDAVLSGKAIDIGPLKRPT